MSEVQPFKCPGKLSSGESCPKTFKRLPDVRQHCAKKHKGQHLLLYNCRQGGCDRVFESKEKLDEHRKTPHERRPQQTAEVKKIECLDPECDQQFTTLGNRNVHCSKQHPDYPAYPCSNCGLAFRTAALRRDHFEEEHCAFFCDVGDCTLGFLMYNNLMNHKVNIHKISSHEDVLLEIGRLEKGVRECTSESGTVFVVSIAHRRSRSGATPARVIEEKLQFPEGSYLHDGIVMNNGEPIEPWQWADNTPMTRAQKKAWPLLLKHKFIILDQVKICENEDCDHELSWRHASVQEITGNYGPYLSIPLQMCNACYYSDSTQKARMAISQEFGVPNDGNLIFSLRQLYRNGDRRFDYLHGKECAECHVPLTDDTGAFALTLATLRPLCFYGDCMTCHDKKALESSRTPDRWTMTWAMVRVREGDFETKEAALELIYNVAIHGQAHTTSTEQSLDLCDLKEKALAAVIYCYWCRSRIYIGGARDPRTLFVVDRTVFVSGPWTPLRPALSYGDVKQRCVASCSRCNQTYMNRMPLERHEMLEGIRSTIKVAKIEGPIKIEELLDAYKVYACLKGITNIEEDMKKTTSTTNTEIPAKRISERINNTTTIFSISSNAAPSPCSTSHINPAAALTSTSTLAATVEPFQQESSPSKKPKVSHPDALLLASLNNRGSTVQTLGQHSTGSEKLLLADSQAPWPVPSSAPSTDKSSLASNSLDEDDARSRWKSLLRLAQERLQKAGITMTEMARKWKNFERGRVSSPGIIGWDYEAFVIYYGINGGRCIVTGRLIQGVEAQTDRVCNNCRYTLGSVMFLSVGSNMAKRLDPRFQHSSGTKGKEIMKYGVDLLQQDFQFMLDQAEGLSQFWQQDLNAF